MITLAFAMLEGCKGHFISYTSKIGKYRDRLINDLINKLLDTRVDR